MLVGHQSFACFSMLGRLNEEVNVISSSSSSSIKSGKIRLKMELVW